MLRRALVGGLAVLLGAVGGLVGSGQVAYAQETVVVCAEYDESLQVCLLELEIVLNGDPATASANVAGGGGGGYQEWCDRGSHYNPDPQLAQLQQVPCNHGLYGWYSQTYDCYFIGSNVSPDDDGVILPDGYQSGDPGAVYEAMCLTPSHPDIPTDNYCFYCTPPDWNLPTQYVFLASEPDGFGGTPDPVPELLVSAVNELALEGPAIGTAPPAGQGSGLVRLPVWLWNNVSGSNWDPPPESVSGAGITLEAEATAAGIRWDMGDGGQVPCDEGVAWQPGMNLLQPECGYQYERPSRDTTTGLYQISATTAWHLEWETQGLPEERGGEFDLEATSTTALQIVELQVLTGGG